MTPRTGTDLRARKSGVERAHSRFVLQPREHVVAALPRVEDVRAERFVQAGRRVDLHGFVGREVQLDPVAVALGREQAALAVEARLLVRLEEAFLPEHVRARHRGVAAEIDLDRRREPAQVEAAVVATDKERRLREVHLARDELHPFRVACFRQHGDGRRVATERLVRERVDLPDAQRHSAAQDSKRAMNLH